MPRLKRARRADSLGTMAEDQITIRDAAGADLDWLAQLWFAGWQDAHADILPAALARVRTLASFRERLANALPSVRVAVRAGAPAGFALLKGNELDQFYVTADARGTGVAPALMADALARLRDSGATTAWLACAIGNRRAARFYEKLGWHRAGVMTSQLSTSAGVFELDVWRYEIGLMASD